MKPEKPDLKVLWNNAITKTRSAERAAAEAVSAGAAYNEALARELEERAALPGWTLDIHGDGKLKPAAECAPPKPQR